MDKFGREWTWTLRLKLKNVGLMGLVSGVFFLGGLKIGELDCSLGRTFLHLKHLKALAKCLLWHWRVCRNSSKCLPYFISFLVIKSCFVYLTLTMCLWIFNSIFNYFVIFIELCLNFTYCLSIDTFKFWEFIRETASVPRIEICEANW